MTKDRDFKRRIRERMAKTGESYTAARAHLLNASAAPAGPPDSAAAPAPAAASAATPGSAASPAAAPGSAAAPAATPGSAASPAPTESSARAAAPAPPASPSLPGDYLARAGMSDEAVFTATGRDWPDWTRWLDERGAAALPHPDIARLLADETPSGWWAQSVAGAYERIRRLRDHGQLRDGTYQANRSRTLPVDAETLFRWVSSEELRARWLPHSFEVGAVNPPRSVRLRWPDGTRVQLYIEPRGESKARIAAQQTRLPDAGALDRQRTFWAERLDALKALLS